MKPEHYRTADTKVKAVIFDIDGVLADPTHRLHYITGEKKNWPAFFRAAYLDTPIVPMCEILKIILNTFTKVVCVTGRSEDIRDATFDWLNEFAGCLDWIVKSDIYMRKAGDRREDWIVKKELYEEHIKDRYDIIAVFEDRKQCVDMWRELGLTCLQNVEGNF